MRQVSLHEGSDDVPFRDSRGRRPRNVPGKGTTRQPANPLPISGNAEWDSALETTWQRRLAPRVQSYRARAERELDLAATGVIGAGETAEWYKRRAMGIAEPRSSRLRACETSTRHVWCGCRAREVAIGCGVTQLCDKCGKKYWSKVKRRMVESLSAAQLPGQRAYVLTLTVPHSGDLVVDRERLARLFARLGREARRHRWWTCYAATYEATPGTRGDGHMHMHVALLSAWVPYKHVHRHWRRILGQNSYHLHFRYRHGCSIDKAAQYIAKYASKGVEVAKFTGAKAGELLAAMYGRRKVTASRRFWMRVQSCPDCGECYRVRPGIGRRAPGTGILHATAEYLGLMWDRWGSRGVSTSWPPQRTLPIC